MVLKKSNTEFNSGLTQRSYKDNGCVNSTPNPLYGHTGKSISIVVAKSKAHAKTTSRTVNHDATKSTENAIAFLEDVVGWEDVESLDIINHQQHKQVQCILKTSLYKKKRWEIADRLIQMMVFHNLLSELQETCADHDSKTNKKLTFPTEIWDAVVSDWRKLKSSKSRIPFFTMQNWTQPKVKRDLKKGRFQTSDSKADDVTFGGMYNNWERRLVQYGLMDVFQNVNLNITDNKSLECRHTLRGRARNIHYTTSQSNQKRSQEEKDVEKNGKLNCKRKSKSRSCHARGIQRPASWKNFAVVSRRSRKRRRVSSESSDHGSDRSRTENNNSGITTHDSNNTPPMMSTGEVQSSNDATQNSMDITIFNNSQHKDARMHNVNFVVKKFGHLPYNAPKVALCKAKGRFRGRLSVHLAYTYARLQEEIDQAKTDIHNQSHENDFYDNDYNYDTGFCDYSELDYSCNDVKDVEDKGFFTSVNKGVLDVGDESSKPRPNGITLNDFFFGPQGAPLPLTSRSKCKKQFKYNNKKKHTTSNYNDNHNQEHNSFEIRDQYPELTMPISPPVSSSVVNPVINNVPSATMDWELIDLKDYV